MRRWALLLLIGLGVVVACDTGSDTGNGPHGISPQPQPNRRETSFRAPCSATRCGDAPDAITNPRCAPDGDNCSWSDNSSVSFRQCPATECGTEPGADVCAEGTIFKGNTCGSENDAPCAWTTACAQPRSTTACPDPEGCGDMPLIGVICSDGGTEGLACMQFKTGCGWQPTCE